MKQKNLFILILGIVFIFLIKKSLQAEGAPLGEVVSPSPQEKKKLEEIKGKIKGFIVWASSRSNSKHDLWIMNADGTEQRQLTKGDNVDWYPRISPDGKKVLFCRSKYGWVSESDAEIFDKWDLWLINIDGSEEKKIVDNATWGSWRPSGDSILFARGPKVIIKSLINGEEIEIFDSEKNIKKGTYSQQPQLSHDGKKLAITIRGTKRETGIWNLEKRKWFSTGGGCQMEWFPDDKAILRMNEGMGNGGTEIFKIAIDSEGKPIDEVRGVVIPKKIRFMDLPGRRSHEYFPKLDKRGLYLVWCATQYGHDHDIADYEVYLWEVNTDPKKDVIRLTFHTANDRWPDIFIEE